MNIALLIPFLILMLLSWIPSTCLAQAEIHKVLDSMVFLHGGTVRFGIDASEIQTFEKTFGIEVPELFQDEVPKHLVTLNDFYMDKYLVNPEWQPGRIPPDLDNGNYLAH